MEALHLSLDEISKARTTSVLISTDLGEYRRDDSAGTTETLPSLVAVPVDGTGPSDRRRTPGRARARRDGRVAAGSALARRPVRRTERHRRRRPQLDPRPLRRVSGPTEATSVAATTPPAPAGNAAVGTWPTAFPPLLGAPIDHVLATARLGGRRLPGDRIARRRRQRPPAGRRAAAPRVILSAAAIDAVGEWMPWATRTDRPHPSRAPSRTSSSAAGPSAPSRARAARRRPPSRPSAARASPRCTPVSASSSRPAREDALERHRLPVPRALRVLAPDRLGQRRRARLRARARAHRRGPRRHALPAPDGRPRLRGVLRERRDRRVLDRPAAEPRHVAADLGLETAASRRVRGRARCDRRHRPGSSARRTAT